MKLSIIVPCHQRDSDDEQYLLSLLGTIPDREGLEVILVDDHSPAPVQVDCAFTATNLYTIKSDQRTAGAARNAGIQKACGEWLMFADSDDLFIPGAIDILLGNLKPDNDVIIGHVEAFKAAGVSCRALTYNAILALAEEDENILLRLHPPFGKAIKRAFIIHNEISFSHTPVSNDVMFNAKLFLSRPRVRIIKDNIYSKRYHSTSLTKQRNFSSIHQRIAVLEDYNRTLRVNGYGDYQVERIKQLRVLYAYPFYIVHSLMRGLSLGEPFWLTPISHKILAARKALNRKNRE